jgi:hypothetical protein
MARALGLVCDVCCYSWMQIPVTENTLKALGTGSLQPGSPGCNHLNRFLVFISYVR